MKRKFATYAPFAVIAAIIGALWLSGAAGVIAQQIPIVNCSVLSSAPTYTSGTTRPCVQTTGGATRTEAGGNVASGATDSGNPVKVGGVYNSTKPTLTNGQRGDLQLGTRGGLNVNIYAADGTTGVAVENPSDANNQNDATLLTYSLGGHYNGSTTDRAFTCPSSAVINVAAAATTQLVALASSQVIRVCSFVISGDTIATTATFVYGTGANCGTGTTSLTGAMRLQDEGNISSTGMNGSLFRTAASNALCLTAAAGAVTGFVTYVQY